MDCTYTHVGKAHIRMKLKQGNYRNSLVEGEVTQRYITLDQQPDMSKASGSIFRALTPSPTLQVKKEIRA